MLVIYALSRIGNGEGDDDYVEYVPLAKRRAVEAHSESWRRESLIRSQPLLPGWMSKKARDFIRKQGHIIVDAWTAKIFPLQSRILRICDFPETVLKKLKAKGIFQPTPIQVQGLPVILSGRDMIGIAFTGSGKTLVFVVLLIMIALQEEVMMPIAPGEEPFGLIICASRELARQTYEVVEQFLEPMRELGYPLS
ncbi:DEAD-box ATP-dependent RNA helicase 35 [Abeliophyllum distichum]|uniref:DEAD-box ATP-dependent RNA helicase 35 n=1 Tax=Abeliophyllum distichum TaxID=126358 RepID=A0ABD1V9I8_9LAMI